eukprot:TRINITY_DN2057_c0_g2_i1.p1 TRINITY_DN2057_c0_g2~~TRINITY_DN2057_c0_g2_i1.p1  ORF type:complete len:112 (-),score=35.75 TRINITY_DN2057_c0_g2_i1:289-624(-)
MAIIKFAVPWGLLLWQPSDTLSIDRSGSSGINAEYGVALIVVGVILYLRKRRRQQEAVGGISTHNSSQLVAATSTGGGATASASINTEGVTGLPQKQTPGYSKFDDGHVVV